MLFSGKKKKDTMGLDIGSSAIKLVQLEETASGYRLTGFSVVSLPPDAVGEGAIKDPPVVVDAIKEAVVKAGVRGTDAVIGVSGHSVIMKKVSLHRVLPEELADAIPLEAEHHIPFPIDDVYLDYQVVGESPRAGGPMDVLLVAVKKAKVDEYIAVVEEAGLDPVVVDVDAFALANQFEVNHPDSGREVVALIDIGASVMKTNMVRGSAPIFARDVPFGGHNYTQAIAQRLKIPWDRAEAAKCGQEVPGVKWSDLVPSLEAVSRELSLEIQRSFDYFASLAESERVDRIVLSGGCARLPGIDGFLGASWGIPVEVVNPFQAIQVSSDRFPAEELGAAAPILAVAVGLGLRRPGDKPR
jgi:type IV pilus assembly protein PilM